MGTTRVEFHLLKSRVNYLSCAVVSARIVFLASMSPTLPYYQYTIAGLALAVMSAELDNAILHAFKTKNLGQIMKRRSNQVVTESGSFFVKTAKDSDEQASKMLEAEYVSTRLLIISV